MELEMRNRNNDRLEFEIFKTFDFSKTSQMFLNFEKSLVVIGFGIIKLEFVEKFARGFLQV